MSGRTCAVSCYRYKMLFRPWTDPTCKFFIDKHQNLIIENGHGLTYLGDMVEIGIWSIIETNVNVICICFITIKPVLRRLFPSFMILKTRAGWSKLRSSRFRRSNNDDSSSRFPSKPATTTYGSFTRLHEGIPQPAAAINGQSMPGLQMTSRNYSIPLQVINTGGRLQSSDDEMV